MSLRKIFAKTVTATAQKDPRLVVIVGDISHGIFRDMRELHPERYFNIGISEPAMVNVAAGLTAEGLIPVVHTIAPFLIERSYEQIKLDFAYQELGVNLISVGSAFDYAKLGCSHHCYSDYSLMAKFEKANILFPGSDIEFQVLFESIYDNGEINYFRLTEFPHQTQFEESQIEFGKGITVAEGTDLTIATTGASLQIVETAAAALRESGVSVEVLYFHTLKPFDYHLLKESVRKSRKLISVEEIDQQDGLYNLALRAIAGDFKFESKQLAIKDFIRIYGTYKELSEEAGLTPNAIIEAAQNLLN